MIDYSQFGAVGATIAILWTLSQEVRFWKLCASCPYKENYKELKNNGEFRKNYSAL